jgi:predicted RNA binding protein YcfA (HicA-like mRNA interferase family)
MVVHRDDPTRVAVVPVHKGQTLPLGTLRSILKAVRLDVDELRALL